MVGKSKLDKSIGFIFVIENTQKVVKVKKLQYKDGLCEPLDQVIFIIMIEIFLNQSGRQIIIITINFHY